MSEFSTVRSVGALLPPDLLGRVIAGDRDLAGLTSADYHLPGGETPREAANRAWSYLTGVWTAFQAALERLPENDPAVGVTREKWLLVLLRELSYGRVPATPAGGLVIADHAFPISHLWESTPMHLLGWGVDLDRRSKGVPGAADRAPHALMQELLNRSDDHLWGLVSNGRVLRLLRDSTSLSGQSYVEFDLQAMFEGEVFSDFVLLFLLAHESRVGVLTPGGPATDCWLEHWRTAAVESGTRALTLLRDGVKAAIEALGTGFLHPASGGDLNRRLQTGELQLIDYHRALLRLVYRLLFLFVAEDRDALHHPDDDPEAKQRYAEYFSTARLRRLALKRQGTRHGDLWQSLSLVIDGLGREEGLPQLGLRGIGGLFDTGPADVVTGQSLPNDALLAAVRHLAVVQPKGQPRRRVDYRNLGAEELGSIYESLLELVPRHDANQRTFSLETLAGNERKTSGSYYTPSALIDLVLDEALEPVLDDAEKSGSTAAEVEAALLAVTVCDPACGSGHFLVAAARRIASRLAVARTGEVDPTPRDLQEAVHDVVARCIYGIDLNPMAAELAKVSLWLEALRPGRPLTFLDAHIKVGNALLGTTPALLADGIPDAAFTAIEGDEKSWVAALKRRNRAEREAAQDAETHGVDQLDMFDEGGLDVSNADLRRAVAVIGDLPIRSLEDVHLAEKGFRELKQDPVYRRAVNVANTWCAAFVARKVEGSPAITHGTLAEADNGLVDEATANQIAALAAAYRFFHWHLEFPEIYPVPAGGARTATGWEGGFSCIVGNPPWETLQLTEKEFFASTAPLIAEAPTAAARRRLIDALADTDQGLHSAYLTEVRRTSAGNSLIRGGRHPLTAQGKINTYSVFAETMRSGIAPAGRAGIITPTGLATDATTAPFFADTLTSKRLAAFYDFENEAKIFAGVHNQFRFAATVITGAALNGLVRFAFYTRYIADVPARRFELAADEVLLLNPNTGTLPVFRSRVDAEITLGVYRRHPVLIRDGQANGNPWGLSFSQGLFNMASDSGLFLTEDDLCERGATFDGWQWQVDGEGRVPLYEAKLLGNYDHRYSTYDAATEAQLNKGTLPRLTDAQHDDPECEPLARYWVAEKEVAAKLGERWDRDWLFGWRDIARASDARTMVPAALPRSAVGDKFLLAYPAWPSDAPMLQAAWSSMAFDYIARQKLSGTGMKYFIIKQLACPTVTAFDAIPEWADVTLRAWVLPRILELTYTSRRIAGYARDILGLPKETDPGPPFRWVTERRELLRAELDAAIFHVYGLTRGEVEHVLDSFTVVRKYEEPDHGEFRTRRLVLQRYDAMTGAAATTIPYETVLDPPPGQGPRHPAS